MKRIVLCCLAISCAASDPSTTRRSDLVTPTYVRSAWTTPGTQTSASVTLSNQGAGNLNVVMVGWFNATSTVTSLVDTQGNAYQLAVGPTLRAGTATQSLYYA